MKRVPSTMWVILVSSAILGAILGLAVACAPAATPTAAAPTPTAVPATPTPPELVHVKWALGTETMTPIILNVDISRSEQLHFCQDLGVDMEIIMTGSGTANLQAVLAGKAQFGAGTAGTTLPPAAEVGGDLPIVHIYNYTPGYKWMIAVLPDSSVQSLSDLAGGNIGVRTLGSSSYPMGKLLLEAVGIDPETDVTWLATGSGVAMGEALRGGEIDALVDWDTGFGGLEVAGYEFRFLELPDIGEIGGVHTYTHADYLEEHRDIAVAVSKCIAQATVFAIENPRAAAWVYYQLHPDQVPGDKTLDEAIDNVLHIIRYRIENWKTEGRADTRWGWFDAVEWANEAELRDLVGVIDPTQFYTNDLINDINDFDEEAIRQMAREFSY